MNSLYILIVLVVAILVLGLVCRLAAPRAWGRWLCIAAMVITALPLLWVAKIIVGDHGKESPAPVFALPGLLLFLELLWLNWILLAAYCPPPPPPPSKAR